MEVNNKNKYKKLEEISNTTYSTIYKAYDQQNNMFVTLKEINKKKIEEGPKDYLITQIQREKDILTKCKSENIIELYDYYESSTNYVFVFEYCEKDLETLIDEKRGLKKDINLFKHLISSLTNSLFLLNENNIIHRDIKPQNILIKENNNNIYFKLADFGVSTYKDENQFEKVGTLLYMAPEIVREEPYNEKVDIWSLGMTLYQAYFGTTPFGKNSNMKKILNVIFSNEMKMKKTENPLIENLDILFRRLLNFNPDERMSLSEFFQYVYNENFLSQEISIIYINEDLYNKYLSIYQIVKESDGIDEDFENQIINESKKSENSDNTSLRYSLISEQMSKFSLILDDKQLKCQKVNNIIYCDFSDKSDLFFEKKISYWKKLENITRGACIYCFNELSLELLMRDVKREYIKDKRIRFNLVVSGRECENVIKKLIKNDYYEIIDNICIFCRMTEKYIGLKNEYHKIKEVLNKIAKVQKFIENTSSKEIKSFTYQRFITYDEYKNKYFNRHKDLSQYYGELNYELFTEQFQTIKKLINSKSKTLHKSEKILLEAFSKFGQDQDLKLLDKIIINEYSKNTFYGDLNRWMFSLNEDIYKSISYFSARLMYSLNNFGETENKFNDKENVLYRGQKLPYASLIPYIKEKNNIILFTGFTSTSEEEVKALKFSGRTINEEKQYGKINGKFSVLFKIINHHHDNWIPCGVGIESVARYKKEKEVLFQPFSFYLIKDVDIDLENFKANIILEVLGKKEIFEERIKLGKITGQNFHHDKSQGVITIE